MTNEADAKRIGEAMSQLDPDLWKLIVPALNSHYQDWRWTYGSRAHPQYVEHSIEVTATPPA